MEGAGRQPPSPSLGKQEDGVQLPLMPGAQGWAPGCLARPSPALQVGHHQATRVALPLHERVWGKGLKWEGAVVTVGSCPSWDMASPAALLPWRPIHSPASLTLPSFRAHPAPPLLRPTQTMPES